MSPRRFTLLALFVLMVPWTLSCGDDSGGSSDPDVAADVVEDTQVDPADSSDDTTTQPLEDTRTDTGDLAEDGTEDPCAAGCFIDGVCVPSSFTAPENACLVCAPDRARSEWSDNDGAACDDGLFCTIGDTCQSGACEGAPRECDDGVGCNGSESCDETDGACLRGASTCEPGELCDPAADACVGSCPGCVIGELCFGEGQRNPDNACQRCNTTGSRDSWTDDDGATCDDGAFCTTGDTCSAGVCEGDARDCSDGVACNGTETCDDSVDTCLPGTNQCDPDELCDPTGDACVTTCTGCVIGGVCYGEGQLEPGNTCRRCDTAVSATGWSNNDGAPCDDDEFCTVGDVCGQGACDGAARDCGDGVACNGDETCNESNDVCDPGVSICDPGEHCDIGSDTCLPTCVECPVRGVTYFGMDALPSAPPCAPCGDFSSHQPDVPVTSSICVVFRDDVDPSTVDASSFVVTFLDAWGRTRPLSGTFAFAGVDPVSGLPSASYSSNQVCLVPSADEYDCAWDRELLYDTPYAGTVTPAVTLLDGASLVVDFTWSFETAAEPQPEEHVPAADTSDVPVVTPIWLRFDAALDPATVDTSTVLLEEASSGTPVSATVILAPDGTTISVTPDALLNFDARYRVTFLSGKSGVLDLRGQWLMDDHSFSFHTSDPNRAVVVPNDLAGFDGSQADLVSVFMERPIDVNTLDDTTLTLENTSLGYFMELTRGWTPFSNAITLVPFSELPSGDYELTIHPGLRDQQDNPHPFVDVQTFAISGNSNTGPSIAVGQDTQHGHLRFYLDANDNLALASVAPSSVILTDGGGSSIPYRVVDYEFGVSDRLWLEPQRYLQAADGPFTVDVTSALTDASRNAAAPENAQLTVETTAPSATLLLPSGNAVPGDATIQVSFDERMDETSTTDPALRLLDGGGAQVPGSGALSEDGLTWTFTPQDGLNAGETYTTEVGAGCTDTAGNAVVATANSFTVEVQAPVLLSVAPADQKTGVASAAEVVLTFDEAMAPESVVASVVGTPGSVTLTNTTSAAEVYACVRVDWAQVVLDPVGGLEPSSEYAVSVDASVTDRAGNALGAAFGSTFVTGP